MQPRTGHKPLPYTIAGINGAAFRLRPLHSLHRPDCGSPLAGCRADLRFLTDRVRNQIPCPKLSARRRLGSLALVLPVRRHPSLSLQRRSLIGRRRLSDRHFHAADHSGVDGAYELLRRTVMGPLDAFGKNLPAKFLYLEQRSWVSGGMFPGLGLKRFALDSATRPDFTDFIISHSHLTVFGTFVVWGDGRPGLASGREACGRELWSFATCGLG